MERRYPTLSQAKIAKIIAHWEKEGLIQASTRKTKSVPHFVKLNPAAYSYFKLKDERRSMAELARARAAESSYNEIEEPEYESWKISTVMIAYAAGLISGIILMRILLF